MPSIGMCWGKVALLVAEDPNAVGFLKLGSLLKLFQLSTVDDMLRILLLNSPVLCWYFLCWSDDCW